MNILLLRGLTGRRGWIAWRHVVPTNPETAMLIFDPTAEEKAELTRILDTIRMNRSTQVWDLRVLDPDLKNYSFLLLGDIIAGHALEGQKPLETETTTTVTFREMIVAITPEEDLDLRDDDILALLEDGLVASATRMQQYRVTADIYTWTTQADRETVRKFRESLERYRNPERGIWTPFRDMLVQAQMDAIYARLPPDAQW